MHGFTWEIRGIYNASASVGNQQHQTLASNASITSSADGTPEVNRQGIWRRVERTWKHSGIQYDFQRDLSDNIIQVKVSFIVTDPDGLSHYYDYVQSGLWDSEEAAKEDTKNNSEGKILLRSTARDGVTLLEFDYDSYDRLVMQKSISPTGNVDGMIIYSYSDENPDELRRLWAGIDENDHSAYPAIPSGGRWVDLSHDPETGRLYSIDSGCHSCHGGIKQYEYGGPSGDLVTAIKQVVLNEQSQPVELYLKRYTYDSRGRMNSYSLGDYELLVNQWERTDFDPADPNGTTGNNILIRRDFVTNTEYRAKVYLADDNGGLTSEIHYHDVQTYDPYAVDQWLVGPYSVYSYSREGSVYVTTYPKGNKLRRYYDANGNVIKRQWEGALHPHVQYEYQDYWYGEETNDPNMRFSQLKKEINAYGGQTVYDYTPDGLTLIRRTDPLPQSGVSDNESQVTEYEYEQGRLTLERTKDSLGQWISTKYEYDEYGNMVKRIEGYGSSNPLETIYQYNEFNENVKVIEPGNKIRRNFYSASGTLTATAVYSDDTNNLAVSATIYVYENGMLKATKEAKMDGPFVFVGSEDGITWVSETYDYDNYGRRIAVIKDIDGEHLATRYEYNNQSEIVLVLKPDQRYQRTVRDGRGLVSKEITGVKVGDEYQDKAVTRYYYDLNGNLTRKVDPEGVTEIYQYDYRDRMVRSRRSR